MSKQTFTTGQVLTAAQVNTLQSNDFNQTVSVKTAAHTLVVGDRGTRVEFNTSGSVTCTVNSGIFDAGDTLVVQNRGAGAVTVTAGTATVNTEGSLVVNQYGSAILYFISASAAILFAGAAGDITAVNAGTGISGGGSSGSVTITNSMATEIDAKGDLIVGTGADTFARLAVGTNGHTLVADSSVSPTGLKWAAPASGGMTLLSTTPMSGSTTTVSIINQTYKKLVVYLKDFYPSGTTAQMSLFMNGFNSGNSYFGIQIGARGSTTFDGGLSNNSGFDMTRGFSNYLINSQTNNFAVVNFDDYANTDSRKIVAWQIGATNDAGAVVNAFGIGTNLGDIGSSAITSISFNTNSGSWSDGTILVYGVS